MCPFLKWPETLQATIRSQLLIIISIGLALTLFHGLQVESKNAHGDGVRRASSAAFKPVCPALDHAKITCPMWDPAQEDGGPDVDLRVRWIHRHQNPTGSDCDELNYLFRSHHEYIGFGADVYLVMVSTLYMALYSNRVFLVDDNVPFRYADCEPQTWQCYFLPLSRCGIADVEASVEAGRRSYGSDYLNASHHIIRASKSTAGISANGPWTWYDRKPHHPWWASDALFSDNEDVAAAALMYVLRPTARIKKEVERALQQVFRNHCHFHPSRSISIPVRGSDKCQGKMHVEGGLPGESECFTSLAPYMAMAEQIRKLDPKVDTIILTSEDARYLDDHVRYAKEGRWQFILNPADTAKGTGTLEVMAAQNHSMHDVFLSMFTSLHLQLKSKYYILNTGSNYHAMIRDLVKYGRCSPTPNTMVYDLGDQYAERKLCHYGSPGGIEGCMEQKRREIDAKQTPTKPRTIARLKFRQWRFGMMRYGPDVDEAKRKIKTNKTQ